MVQATHVWDITEISQAVQLDLTPVSAMVARRHCGRNGMRAIATAILFCATASPAWAHYPYGLAPGEQYHGVGQAVNGFISCSRASKSSDVGTPAKDKDWPYGDGSFLYCGAFVHWSADDASWPKSCLDKRAYGEDVSRTPSRKRGLKAYLVSYDCQSAVLVLEVDVTKDGGKVVRMFMADLP